MIEIKNLTKIYNNGKKNEHVALKNVPLTIKKGEIFALLGPNGAGKTTLIEAVCGLVEPSSGTIHVGGHDIVAKYKEARSLVGIVPQELNFDSFSTILETMKYTRGFFGKQQDLDLYEGILKKLSLWNKRNHQIRELSGGMKRRVLIARALVSEPEALFLDEPTAGVDVELRRELMDFVQKLNDGGMTIILTTHYLEEAERLADRIGLIQDGKLQFVKTKETLFAEHPGKSLEDIYIRLVGRTKT